MVRDTGCTLVSLRETKLDLVEVVEETLGSDFVRNFALLPAQGTQGGSFTAVHENFCGLSDAQNQPVSISARIAAAITLSDWWVTVVYVSQEGAKKLAFLDEIRQICMIASEKNGMRQWGF